MRTLILQPDSTWWDNPKTAGVETRDDNLRLAFTEGLLDLQKQQGADPAKWHWGDLHTLTFRNQTLGESGVAPIESLFNRGPYATAGGASTANATGWDVPDGFQVDWLPSMRMIVDLSNLSQSLTVHTTGQSGHAYHPHYIDQVDLWRMIQYHPMLWDEAGIIAAAEGHLRLLP